MDERKAVEERMEKLSGREGKIAKAFVRWVKADYRNRQKHYNELYRLLFSGKTTAKEVLDGGLFDFFVKLLSPGVGEKHCKMVERLTDYMYNITIYRRAAKSGNISAYSSRITELMRSVYFPWEQFDLAEYLSMGTAEWKKSEKRTPDSETLSVYIALEIDLGNREIIDGVKEIILSENNVRILDHTVIKAVARSSNSELHNLMKDLLLAAKLQEGLRQAVFETADSGTLEYFLTIMKAAIDSDLIRYSSCLRGVCVWMGLGYGYEDKRVIEKVLLKGYEYLNDKEARRAAMNSSDAVEIYSAMWAESVYDLEKTNEYIKAFMGGDKYQRLIALYFLREMGNHEYSFRVASQYLDETDLDLLAYIMNNYYYNPGWARDRESFRNNCRNIHLIEDKKLRDLHFDKLAAILVRIPKNGHQVTGKPFDWAHAALDRDYVFNKLLENNGFDGDPSKTLKLISLAEYAPSNVKIRMMDYLLDGRRSEEERQFLFSCLSDKSMPVRVAAAKIIKDLDIRDDEIDYIENLLALKTGEIRQIALDILKNRQKEDTLASAKRLLIDKAAQKRLGGLDLLAGLAGDDQLDQQQIKEYTSLINNATEQEKVLIDNLTEEQPDYLPENGFGLYDPGYRPQFPPLSVNREYTLKTFHKDSHKDIVKAFESLTELIEENRDYTYLRKNWDDSETEVVFGTQRNLQVPAEKGKGYQQVESFDDYVLAPLWKQWVENNKIDLYVLYRIDYINNTFYYKNGTGYEDWCDKLMRKHFGIDQWVKTAQWCAAQKYRFLAMDIVKKLIGTFSQEAVAKINCSILADMINTIKADEWTKTAKERNTGYYSGSTESILCELKEVNYFTNNLDAVRTGEAFVKRLSACYEIGRISGLQYMGLDEVDIAAAVDMGAVDINDLYRTFMRQSPDQKMRMYTGPLYNRQKASMEKYPILQDVAQEVAQRVIDIEVKRGDTPTPVSSMAQAIRRHEGVKNFSDVLVALGKETLTRGYVYGGHYTKKDVLSSLLKASVPAPEDNAEALKTALDGRVTEKRLLEAAMYAPAWIAIVEELLGWEGLKSGAWYFHAHTSNSVSKEFETEVARFSPISREDFQDGAFDINWFKSAYKELGSQRFDTLYNCAKYICDGTAHRRAQLFADAVLGRLDSKALPKEISDKRNKDKLMSYSLIPLGKDPLKDALGRYDFIQNFLKESKQFGAQRRESERKTANIALQNLARNLGYDDTLRFSWKMETLKMDEMQAYFIPRTVEEWQLHVEAESAELIIEKDGKKLKSVPSKLKKDPYVEELKKVRTSLKDQYKRARASLERAMENQDAFPFEELLDLMNHPVIAPLISKLVFLCGDQAGFISKEGLVDPDGTIRSLNESDMLTIAHCFNLYKTGKWSDFQRYAFDNQLIQPFKQIFRELYLVNEDEEKEKTISRRYAGNQVQPKKTVALLKGRGWTVDYDYGLQKVFHRENIIATMYALADWFSPADMEAPTLETVEFKSRKTYRSEAFADINPILFSETMRDVDLVVSVAHVGGVDPLASHSTVQMRGVIVTEAMRLLKAENVTVEGSHAKIKGIHGEYTVHLGSGIAHKMGKGALNILPVHSQYRGKVFLPFLDEDPKTAEIVSKVLMLAQDNKIKDPSIMNQIV